MNSKSANLHKRSFGVINQMGMARHILLVAQFYVEKNMKTKMELLLLRNEPNEATVLFAIREE
jgi:hypothetical protein